MYNYTENNLLLKPEKYQMTLFEGKNFLDDYRKNRLKIVSETKNMSNKELINQLLNLEEIKQFKNTFTLKNFVSKHFFLQLLNYYIDNKSINYVDIFDNLLKKFENKKKIFLTYDENFSETSSDYDDIENYILFSLCSNIFYFDTKNLKYFNSVLKVNDLIISIDKTPKNTLFKKLFASTLQMELNNVKMLCQQTGVI